MRRHYQNLTKGISPKPTRTPPVMKSEIKSLGTSKAHGDSGTPNFAVDTQDKFLGSYIINLLEGQEKEYFKVGIQLAGTYPNGAGEYIKVYGTVQEVEVFAVRRGNRVDLYIPAISLTIPDYGVDGEGNPFGGPSYLLVSGPFIPSKFRPTCMAGESFSVGSNVTSNPTTNDYPQSGLYQGTVYRNGSFRYATQGGYPIQPGQLIADAVHVSYLSNPYWVPENFLLSTWGRSNVILSTQPSDNDHPVPPTSYPYQPPLPFKEPGTIDYFTRYGGYYEYNYIVFNDGKIYTLFADNSHTPNKVEVTFPKSTGTPPQLWPGYGLNGAFTKLKLKGHGKCKKLKQEIAPYYVWGPDKGNFFQSESGIAVNPVNPDIVVCYLSITPVPFFYHTATVEGTPAASGGMYMISYDGGKSFKGYNQFYNGFLGIQATVFGYDQGLYFDRFGNLWFVALAATPNEVPLLTYVFVTPMGDPNGWRLVASFGTYGTADDKSTDYPRGRVGPGVTDAQPTSDGGQPEAFWVSMFLSQTFYPQDFATPNQLWGIQVYGPVSSDPTDVKTNLGTGVGYQPQSTANGAPADFLIYPDGSVSLISTGSAMMGLLSSGVNYQVLYSNYNSNGVYGDFGNRQNIGYVSMGGDEAIEIMTGGAGSPYDHLAGCRIQGDVDRSGGQFNGRAYVVFMDKKEITPNSGYSASKPSNKQIIGLTWSDNKGVSWADPIFLNNDVEGDHCHLNPCISIDQTTGNIAVAFYDARTCPLDHAVNWVCAIITPADIERVEKLRKCIEP